MSSLKVQIPDADGEFPVVFENGGRVFKVWEPQYTNVLNAGFVGIVDYMGDDAAIAEAARTSYAKGTKRVRSEAGLIRYLLKHDHTTPFEMCSIKFHVKCPIFVARQWHRHRTASINEQSGRYSEMSDEFHMPDPSELKPQSKTNKQGRDGELSAADANAILYVMRDINEQAYDAYEYLLGKSPTAHWSHSVARNEAAGRVLESLELGSERPTKELIDAALSRCSVPVIDQSQGEDGDPLYPGLARETAREVLPVSLYTQFYWKANLLNTFRFLALRMDPHAQLEIRQYANAMHDLLKPLFPHACKAFDDYWFGAVKLSRMEWEALKSVKDLWLDQFLSRLKADGTVSEREVKEFLDRCA